MIVEIFVKILNQLRLNIFIQKIRTHKYKLIVFSL